MADNVIPFPTKRTTYTFALTTEDAPDPVELVFDPPDEKRIAQMLLEIQNALSERTSGGTQAARGIGGDAQANAISALYQSLIDRQKKINVKTQQLLNEAVDIRYQMEIVRQIANAK